MKACALPKSYFFIKSFGECLESQGSAAQIKNLNRLRTMRTDGKGEIDKRQISALNFLRIREKAF